MKDLQVFVDPPEIDCFVRAQWQTDAFRASHDARDGWVRHLVDDFARLPRLFCELSDPPIERSHFFAWMGVVPLRHEYDNPAIADLYLLHEYLHAAQLTYEATDDRKRWAQKIWDNERDASLGSEVYVYFELEGFRDSTFGFEIWADRFLTDPHVVALHRDDPARFDAYFVERREHAMTHPEPGDRNEALIASYARANLAWAEVWRSSYRDVEATMAQFVAKSVHSRSAAAAFLQAWIGERQGDGLCPFEAEARGFAEALAQTMHVNDA